MVGARMNYQSWARTDSAFSHRRAHRHLRCAAPACRSRSSMSGIGSGDVGGRVRPQNAHPVTSGGAVRAVLCSRAAACPTAPCVGHRRACAFLESLAIAAPGLKGMSGCRKPPATGGIFDDSSRPGGQRADFPADWRSRSDSSATATSSRVHGALMKVCWTDSPDNRQPNSPPSRKIMDGSGSPHCRGRRDDSLAEQ
jgi:hypothetical protein